MRNDFRLAEGDNALNTTEFDKGLIDWNDVLKRQTELQNIFWNTDNKQNKRGIWGSRKWLAFGLKFEDAWGFPRILWG